MNDYRMRWTLAEENAKIQGWDFSPMEGRICEDDNFPWNYETLIKRYVKPTDRILDLDTGGGEKLLALGHDPSLTSATEGYKPNIAICMETLLPRGIDFRPCENPSSLPFEEETFDAVLNRHGSYDFAEICRVLKPGGIFLTQQVGEDNDRDLVAMVLPDLPKPFPGHNLMEQKTCSIEQGFSVFYASEAYRYLDFFDIEAFIWFAKIVPWEFSGFSVERCFSALENMNKILMEKGRIRGTTHRFCLGVRKNEKKS